MASAVVGARLRNVLNSQEARRQRSRGSSAIRGFLARASVKRRLGVGGARSAPTAEDTNLFGRIEAGLAVRDASEIGALGKLNDRDIARNSGEVGGAIGTVEAEAIAVDTSSMTTAVVAIVVAVTSDRARETASSGISTSAAVIARAGCVLTVADTITAAVVGARKDLALAIASDGEALSVLHTSLGDKSSRGVV